MVRFGSTLIAAATVFLVACSGPSSPSFGHANDPIKFQPLCKGRAGYSVRGRQVSIAAQQLDSDNNVTGPANCRLISVKLTRLGADVLRGSTIADIAVRQAIQAMVISAVKRDVLLTRPLPPGKYQIQILTIWGLRPTVITVAQPE